MKNGVLQVLEGRPLEIALAGAQAASEAGHRAVDARALMAKETASFYAILELATGLPDPETLVLNVDTGEVTRRAVDDEK